MQKFDKRYIELQFKLKVLESKSTVFQGFFEKVMQTAFNDFIKVQTYGNKGDGGNDGYRKDVGYYYQVYSPKNPQLKIPDAVKKLKKNFSRLKSTWGSFSDIKRYYFVFNNNFLGTFEDLEKALAELRNLNPDIEFHHFLAEDLEKVFWTLDEEPIQRLGFDVSQRDLILTMYKSLKIVEDELDMERLETAQYVLNNVREEILKIDDDQLSYELRIIESLVLKKSEKINEATVILSAIDKSPANDIRALLLLSEIKLHKRLYSEAKSLLDSAEEKNPKSDLINVYKLVYQINSHEQINLSNFYEDEFKHFRKEIRSNIYRLYSIAFAESNEFAKARDLIDKAITIYPQRVMNKLSKVVILQLEALNRLSAGQKPDWTETDLGIAELDKYISENVPIRFKTLHLHRKSILFRLQNRFNDLENLSQELFNCALECYFDNQIDNILSDILSVLRMPDVDLLRLIAYLSASDTMPSQNLEKRIVLQLSDRGTSENELIKKFKLLFTRINTPIFGKMIDAIYTGDYKSLEQYLDPDIAISLATTNSPSVIREQLLQNYDFKDKTLQQRLQIQFLIQQKDFPSALEKVQALNLSQFSSYELLEILRCARIAKAWQIAVIIIESLLEKEQPETTRVKLEFDLFQLSLIQQDYAKSIKISETILHNYVKYRDYLEIKDLEYVLVGYVQSAIYRSRLDPSLLERAQQYVEKIPFNYPENISLSIGVISRLYIISMRYDKALDIILSTVRGHKKLTQEDYILLYFPLCVEIASGLKLAQKEEKKAKAGDFVKLSNIDEWIYLGNETPLSATIASNNAPLYQSLINKNVGARIIIGVDQRTELVEHIFNFNSYLIECTASIFSRLAPQGAISGVYAISMLKDGVLDLSKLKQFLCQQEENAQSFFSKYIEGTLPFSLLVTSEQSIAKALGRIQSEQQGFVHMSSGTQEELDIQVSNASDTVMQKLNFVLDAMSAMFLVESGLLEKVIDYIPNLIIPQSVINLLIDLLERFSTNGEHATFMGLTKGEIFVNKIDSKVLDLSAKKLRHGIQLLESKCKKIAQVSPSDRGDSFSESKIPHAFSDACIIAQKDNMPIMTDDFLYLHLNKLQTKKPLPKYFSSFALVRSLYEEKVIDSDSYYGYFNYLAKYRARFLPISSMDIEDSIFGSAKIKHIEIDGVDNLNLGLTLSSSYGVTLSNAIQVVSGFIFRLIRDDSINMRETLQIFNKIVRVFPSEIDKYKLFQLLIKLCRITYDRNTGILKISELFFKKLAALDANSEIFQPMPVLTVPKDTNVQNS
ncbi:hypothetical protein IT418_02780 [bacterium]|nr:hypothetical protein [bacterium]